MAAIVGLVIFVLAVFRPPGTTDLMSISSGQNESFLTPVIPGQVVTAPVLMYHYVRVVADPQADQLGFSLSVTPAAFETQMTYLISHGFTTITPDDLWQAVSGQSTLPPKPVLITFDDGYADFYTAAWPILKKYNLKATAFVVTGFLSDLAGRYLTWSEVRELDRSGLVTIADHTAHHVNVATSAQAEFEIVASKQRLEAFLGHAVTAFAYPGGTFNIAAEKMVAKSGFNFGFTTQGGRSHSLAARLAAPRVRVSGGETLATFIARLEGSPLARESVEQFGQH